jgi:hypothetical protein
MAKLAEKPIKKVSKAVVQENEVVKKVSTPKVELQEPMDTISIVDIIMEKVEKQCEANKMEGKQYSLEPMEIRNILRSVL